MPDIIKAPVKQFVVQIPGHVIWTITVEAGSEAEALKAACDHLEGHTELEPDDNPEPEFSDAEVVETIDETPAQTPEAA